jgi:hypothetical protein
MKIRYGEKRYQIRQGSKNTFEKKAKQLKILLSGEATSISLKSAVRENVTFRLRHQMYLFSPYLIFMDNIILTNMQCIDNLHA